jgi:hypothetical protein
MAEAEAGVAGKKARRGNGDRRTERTMSGSPWTRKPESENQERETQDDSLLALEHSGAAEDCYMMLHVSVL